MVWFTQPVLPSYVWTSPVATGMQISHCPHLNHMPTPRNLEMGSDIKSQLLKKKKKKKVSYWPESWANWFFNGNHVAVTWRVNGFRHAKKKKRCYIYFIYIYLNYNLYIWNYNYVIIYIIHYKYIYICIKYF